MFRCQKCGRPIKREFKKPGDRMPFCNGAKGCDKAPLPRCLVCHSLYKPERAVSKRDLLCVKGKQTHLWSTDGVNEVTAKEMAAFDKEVIA